MMREEYTLILKHELVDRDGIRIMSDDPIIVKQSFMCGIDNMPLPIIINEMMDRMKQFVLKQIENRQ